MKISNSSLVGVKPRSSNPGSTERASTSGGQGRQPDSVRVSSTASQIATQVATGAREVEGADSSRVAELKAEVESGHFPIDIHALAQAILREDTGIE